MYVIILLARDRTTATTIYFSTLFERASVKMANYISNSTGRRWYTVIVM